MDDIRIQIRQQAADPGDSAGGHADLPVLRHRERRDTDDAGAVHLGGAVAPGPGSDDDRFVTALREVFEDPHHTVRDTVRLGEEGFCNHRYSHDFQTTPRS
ncbi:hypothetical protein GCM10009755_06150 [Brevibacterium samyangense]|uniref:Uncharacterized protein n=1 Tax=Brevibacterium samyangense TaxID=366888 RepID=A0ABN2T7G6_9MICO